MFFQISRRVFTQPDYQHLCFTATTAQDATSSRVICHCKKQEQEAACVMRELFSENCHLLFKTKIPSLQFWRRRRRQRCGCEGNNRPQKYKTCVALLCQWNKLAWKIMVPFNFSLLEFALQWNKRNLGANPNRICHKSRCFNSST